MSRAHCLAVLCALLIVAFDASAQEAAKPAQEWARNVQIKWHPDVSDRFTLVRTNFDQKTRKVAFLLEARADLKLKGNEFDIHLFDADKVRIHVIDAKNQWLEGGIMELSDSDAAAGQGTVRWTFLKGERLRVSTELPDAKVWARVRHAFVGGRILPSAEK